MRNPELTRQRLIEVAVRAMAQYGEAGVRVDRIAAESGINKRMIYHYFGGKEGLRQRASPADLSIEFYTQRTTNSHA